MATGIEKLNWTNAVNYRKILYTVFGFVFLTSGLIINFLQLVSYVLIRPFSKSVHKKINKHLTYSIFSQLIFLQQYWADVKVSLFCNKNDYLNYFGKESALLIYNHSYEIDWLIGWSIGEHFGLLGYNKIFAKKSLQYVPTVGFAWKFGGSIFLERNWEKDKKCVERKIKELASSTDLVCLILTAEGTRFTKEKQEACVEFAKKHGLPILKHHLTPRTKGFTTSIPLIRNKINAIYNVNVGIKQTSVKPTFTNLLMGKKIEADFFIERIEMKDLPEGEEELSRWLHDLYKRKDDLVDNFLTTGQWIKDFNRNKYIIYPLPRRKHTAVNFIFWAFSVLAPMTYFMTKVLVSGNLFYLSIAVAFFMSFKFALDKLIGQSQVSKGSSYGATRKSYITSD